MNVKKRKNIPRVLVGILAIVWFAGLAFFAPDAMAAIAFRVTAINEGSGTTASTAKPAGLAAGDAMLMAVGAADTNPNPSISTPTGWTEVTGSPIYTNNTPNDNFTTKVAVFYKVADQDDVDSWNNDSTIGDGGRVWEAGVLVYSGTFADTFVCDQATDTGLSTAPNGPSISGCGSDAWSVIFVVNDGSFVSHAPATGMTERYDPVGTHQTGNDSNGTVSDPTGAFSDFLLGSSSRWAVFHVVIKEAAASSPPDSASPGDVTNLSAASQDDGSIQLAWTNPTNPDFSRVRIFRSTQSSFSPSGQNEITAVSGLPGADATYIDADVAEGTTYTYILRTQDKTGNIQTGLFNPKVSATSAVMSTPEEPPADTGDGEDTTQEPPADDAGTTEESGSDETSEPTTPLYLADTTGVFLHDRDLVWEPHTTNVYVIAGAYRRLIRNPQIFALYGHLSWSNIHTVSPAVFDAYKRSQLVRAADEEAVYLISENTLTKQHLNMTPTRFEELGYDWNAVFIINQQERDYYVVGTDIT